MSEIPNGRPIPYAEIVYQPSSVYRMRYEAENRSTHLVAENYLPERDSPSSIKTRKKSQTTEGQYPRVKIINGEGPATLIVSCVNKIEPYFVHPHKLIGSSCKHGVAVFNIDKGQTVFDVIGVSIQFTKKSDIEERINELKEKNVDPFNLGFNFDKKSIDLSCVRLCFQIYLRDSFETTEIKRDKYHILKPLVSQVISNSSRKITLSIISTFNLSGSCDGGSEVIVFIKKLEKDQKTLKAKFYDNHGWSSIVDIEDSKIHYQCALSFKAPKYPRIIDKEETVFFKLFVPFKSEEERENDDEDSMELNGQASSSSLSSLDSRQLGQYESRDIEFVYRPSVLNGLPDQRNLTESFFGFSEAADREAVSHISSESRKNLHKRHFNNLKNFNPRLSNIPNDIIYNDPILTNNLIVDNINIEKLFENNEFNIESFNYPPEITDLKKIIEIVNSKEDETNLDFIDTNDLFLQSIADSLF